MELRTIHDGEIEALADLATPLQQRPDSHITYLGTDAVGIAAELDETTWHEVSAVAESDSEVVGWLVGDIDPEMGRVWWIGPYVIGSHVKGESWTSIAGALLAACRGQLPDTITEEEMAVDARFEPYCEWAATEGFAAEEGSWVLELDGPLDPPCVPVRDITSTDHDRVARLHEELFRGTHTSGDQLVEGHDDTHRRLVVEHNGGVAGYIAVEVQADGSGYIDYIGVDPAQRRNGLGADLVRAGVAELRRLDAAGIGLTVREGSDGARELYASLGFREERFVVPLRRGFSLA